MVSISGHNLSGNNKAGQVGVDTSLTPTESAHKWLIFKTNYRWNQEDTGRRVPKSSKKQHHKGPEWSFPTIKAWWRRGESLGYGRDAAGLLEGEPGGQDWLADVDLCTSQSPTWQHPNTVRLTNLIHPQMGALIRELCCSTLTAVLNVAAVKASGHCCSIFSIQFSPV